MVWLALLAAVVEAFLVPFRIGDVKIPIALVLAILGNLTLPALALRASGSKFVTTLPAVVWFIVIVALAGGTAEGDVVLAGNDWTALLLLLVGSIAAAAGVYFALLIGFPLRLRKM